MSIIDDLFEEIYGYRPAKDGQAYEILAATVMKILEENNTVYHDERLRGKFSQTLYQIDALLESESGKLMGEAKDYTERSAKVGRGDLQKLGGALNDVEVNGGLFFSATDYTKPAKKYAEASDKFIGKEIKLLHLRPSIGLDEEGRIKTIDIELIISLPDYDNARFSPLLTVEGNDKIKSLVAEGTLQEGAFHMQLDTIYDKNKNTLATIRDLTSHDFGGGSHGSAQGSFILHGGYIKIKEHLIEIHGISYDIPFKSTSENIIIEAEGTPKLLIKDEQGNVNKLITDAALKKIKLQKDGTLNSY